MKPTKEFSNKPKSFWATVRLLSQQIGYSRQGAIIVPTFAQIHEAFGLLDLDPQTLVKNGSHTQLADELLRYFNLRSMALMEDVEPKLLNAEQAKELFEEIKSQYPHQCPFPMNKQKGEKRTEAYLTGLVNMMVERYSNGAPCDFDPGKLTTVTQNRMPLRTFARRVDGAFPSSVNPIAIWEIKEYYYTRTFGSRVADGIYETLLDGMEVEELRYQEDVDIKHYLMVDAHYTWWSLGKSYLCRMFDMLHMGYVDEILFGREVVDEMPRIVEEWLSIYEKRTDSNV